MEFQINATSQGARACTIKTAHSTILTPVFMPVGTQGTVKALDANDMLEMGAKMKYLSLIFKTRKQTNKKVWWTSWFFKISKLIFNR